MIISKAIELLEISLHPVNYEVCQDHLDALKLGIEALKRIEHVRTHPWSEIYAPLPGETMPDRGIR